MNTIINEDVMSEHMEKMSIQRDDVLLDLGCGDGTYTISFAKLLGRNGRIYALDSDSSKLDELRKKAIELCLEKRIKIIKTKGELEVPLEGELIHICLLYNVACCIHGKEDLASLIKLVQNLHRVTIENGRLIINVKGKHIEKRMDNAIPDIEKYFTLEEKEKKKYFLENKKVRYRFFYYFLKKQKYSVRNSSLNEFLKNRYLLRKILLFLLIFNEIHLS